VGYTDKSEVELTAELDSPVGLASRESMFLSKVVAALELQRRRIADLTKSSNRLEGLTRILIVLTVVLALLTAILAAPEIRRVAAWLATR